MTYRPAEGLRIWSAHTTDWQTFTKPEKFFDRGFPAIDATMFHRDLHGTTRRRHRPQRPDHRPAPLQRALDLCSDSQRPVGSTLRAHQRALVRRPQRHPGRRQIHRLLRPLPPTQPRYEGVETTDWVHWTSVNDKMHFPANCKHGSFFRVTEDEAQRLLARHDPGPGNRRLNGR